MHIASEVNVVKLRPRAYVPNDDLAVEFTGPSIHDPLIAGEAKSRNLGVCTKDSIIKFDEFLKIRNRLLGILLSLLRRHNQQIAARVRDDVVLEINKNIISLVVRISADDPLDFQLHILSTLFFFLDYLFSFELVFLRFHEILSVHFYFLFVSSLSLRCIQLVFVEIDSLWEVDSHHFVHFLGVELFKQL